jgi:hypothetical protein
MGHAQLWETRVMVMRTNGYFCNDTRNDGGNMSITSAQSYELRIAREGDRIADPPQPYWQTVERLVADRGVDHVARLLAYALRDLDKAQGKA